MTVYAWLALGGVVYFLVLAWVCRDRPLSDTDRYCSEVDRQLDLERVAFGDGFVGCAEDSQAMTSQFRRSEVAEKVAAAFHEAYERLAPEYGYSTREESATSWEDVPLPNRLLMMATVLDLIDSGTIYVSGGAPTTGRDHVVTLQRGKGEVA